MPVDADTDAALRAAIRANPDDNLPRLVYCDFLEESGDEAAWNRAEFIRQQLWGIDGQTTVWWRTRPPDDGEFLFTCWRLRFEGWTKRNFAAVVPRSHPLHRPSRSGGLFVRGFVEEFHATAEQWQRSGDALVAEWPIRRVVLSTRPLVNWQFAEARGQWHVFFANEPPKRRVFVSASSRELLWYNGTDGATDAVIERLLRAHWPTVREWQLPPQTPPVGVGDPLYSPLRMLGVDRSVGAADEFLSYP